MIFLLNTTEKKRFNSTNDFPKIMFLSSTNFKKPGRTVDSIDSVTRVQSSTFITDGRFPILRRVKKKKKVSQFRETSFPRKLCFSTNFKEFEL